MPNDEITQSFDELYDREGDRIVAGAVTARQIAEFFFRHGWNRGKCATVAPINEMAAYVDSVSVDSATARAL